VIGIIWNCGTTVCTVVAGLIPSALALTCNDRSHTGTEWLRPMPGIIEDRRIWK
jgi:hypothetical protein